MLNRIRRIGFVALLASLSVATGCQDVVDALTEPTTSSSSGSTGGGNSQTQITFWTSDTSPSYIAVSVDGVQVGTLTAYRSSAPTCGASTTGGTLTVNVSPGQHTISARETSASGTWGPSQVNVSSGSCLTYRFDG